MMTPESMSARIKAALAQLSDPHSYATPQAYTDAVHVALCQGIVAEIQQAAVVTVASVSGVTSGTAVSGPGTGTIK